MELPTVRSLVYDDLGGAIVNLLAGTPLEGQAEAIAAFTGALITSLVGFAAIMLSMFMILWIERKQLGRMMDRRGAMTSLRSLWIGENGTTAGAWWDMVPFIGKPIGAVNRWLNARFGNHDPDRPTVDRVNNRSWMGFAIFPGFFQNIADGMKFLIKEHMVPERADKLVFEVAPYLVISSTVLILGLIPMGAGIYGANPELSVLFAMAVFGIAPIGVFFGGWASNNKYTLIGGIRSAVQLTSYEIPLLLTVLSVCVVSGSFNFVEIVTFQGQSGAWNLFLLPLGGALFLISMLAEVERIPFDMPEAEAELVEGWWTEYGGMRFGLLFAAEYMRTYAACILFAHFFLGGWHAPFSGVWGGVPILGLASTSIIWVLLKAWLVFAVVFVWARVALLRIRTDQILEFGWRILLPLSVINLLVAVLFRLFLYDPAGVAEEGLGNAWGLGIFAWTLPLLVTVVSLGLFFYLLNDEDKDASPERMFHVRTLEPAGTVVPGTE